MTSSPSPQAPERRSLALGLLLVVYTLNFVDRQILGILAQPIKAELALTDTQLGLLGGLAFGLFYATLAVPIAWAADRMNRVWIITVALALWSGFTALCGVAQNFTQLFLARLGVGVGEAGGVAPSFSLIADYFPPEQRARALAIFSFGIPIGSALGIFFGGWVASNVDWRTAFVVVGLAGVLFAPVFRLLLREPVRGRLDHAPVTHAPPFREVLRLVANKRSFWLLAAGASLSSMMGYGLIFWIPPLLQRSFDLSLIEASRFYGAIALFGGVAGIWAGGWLSDRLGRRDRRWFALVPAIAFLATAPAYALGVTSQSVTLAFVLFLIPGALALVWVGPTIATVQALVPPAMRATASAIFLLFNNLIGLGGGTLFLGGLSDQLAPTYGEESLRYAILFGLPLYLAAGLLFLIASRRLARDWA